MSEIKLNPCPLCGGGVELANAPTFNCIDIECEKCNARFTFFEVDKAEAAAKFNARPIHPDSKRIDWIADPKQKIGQLLLPKKCVTQNPTNLRDAIDMAISIDMAKKL